ncbi:MAG TPA: hypothetical protein VE173_07330, partial [Longimicrobiales bacterium]|nr:hypothetical protein [Longimicrobiales bacterium]
DLSMGHARALLSVDDPVRAGDLARAAVRDGWTVRETERRAGRGASRSPSRRRAERTKDPLLRALEDALQESLSTRVNIKRSRKGKGVIEIAFHGPDDFERVFELVTGREASEVVG